ncbi:MAG: hypothetical protein BM556_05775 [Bacteriovorax sp. MedPE-SWde]|nr:MAG: hypothetical protein BM556_05775 [Bacteriovorax sp. MedPE-SWde]
MFKKISLLLFLIACSTYAFSENRVSSKFRGEGLYSWYFLDVYTAKLWADEKNIYEGNLSLELEYHRDLKGKDIANRSVAEMRDLGHDDLDYKEVTKVLTKIFPDVKKGDKILANYRHKVGIEFLLNKKTRLGQISDVETSKKFLDIWFHKKTSGKLLKKKLLGLIE